MIKLANKIILVISPESWDHNFVSKHHYAIHLAARGNKVFFLNPPSDKASCTELKDFKNLHVIDYVSSIRGLNKLPRFVSLWIWKQRVQAIEKLARCKFDVVWSFDPYRFQDLRLFNKALRIYYAADDHKNKRLEKIVTETAHCIFSPSRAILDQIQTPISKIGISHAVSTHFFDVASTVSLPGENKVKAGYVGNLHMEIIDRDLILALVDQLPFVDFVFAGENARLNHDPVWKEILLRKNVYCVGRIPSQAVPSFLKSCDVLFLVYKKCANSHKVLEYLSSGNVVISTPIDEYLNHHMPGNLLYMCEQYDLYVDFFKSIISELSYHTDTALRNQRIEYARQRSYPIMLTFIEEKLSEAMAAYPQSEHKMFDNG